MNFNLYQDIKISDRLYAIVYKNKKQGINIQIAYSEQFNGLARINAIDKFWKEYHRLYQNNNITKT